MIIFILFVIFFFILWTGLSYLIVYYSLTVLDRITKSKLHLNKTLVLISTLFLAVLTAFLLFIKNPEKNYKNAYLEEYQGQYKVTVKGKRVGMSHDPISAVLARTYEDSISYYIPMKQGLIQSNEIKVSKDSYKPTGTILINGKKMTIKLFYDHTEKDPDNWNGNYYLSFR